MRKVAGFLFGYMGPGREKMRLSAETAEQDPLSPVGRGLR